MDHKPPTDKPQLSLVLEMPALPDVARSLSAGIAKGYARGSWAFGLKSESEYLDAALRHIHAHMMGEEIDPDAGDPRVLHLASAVASLLIAMSKRRLGVLVRNLTFDADRTRSLDALKASRAYVAADGFGVTQDGRTGVVA